MKWLGYAALTLPVVGGIAGYLVAGWHNENCPTSSYVLGVCTRLKPVHTAVLGVGAGFAAMVVLLILGRAILTLVDDQIDG